MSPVGELLLETKKTALVYVPVQGNDDDVEWEGEHVVLDDMTLMQYTGLKDKNGKEIFEGDVTTSEIGDEPMAVVFWEGCFCHKWPDGNGHIFNPKNIEIIGNIYENPELLAA
jgi:hypothetical protein